MLNITIIAIGKVKEVYWREAILEYQKRLQPYARLKIEELKAEPFSESTKGKAKKTESDNIQLYLDKKKTAEIYLLSEHGELFDSPAFAKKMESNQEIVLVIAGTQGFAKDLVNKYPKISLSPLTFPHELARVVLLEQLYRAATIINKKDYHY
ncbi:MAG: 23S rRNA (pseudouridine(1915)-N(3))-methyltransferase RlmH [Patescibacteria group bacterium]